MRMALAEEANSSFSNIWHIAEGGNNGEAKVINNNNHMHYCRARPTLLIRGRSTSFMRWIANPMIMKALKSMMQGGSILL